MKLLIEIVLLICLALLMVAAVAEEGRTIARCLAAVRGPGVLTRLGAGFLLTEVVLVALVGLAGGAYPHMTHAVLGAAWLPLGFFVAGWMLRDIGLWHGPVVGGRLRGLVVVGAGVQTLSVLATLACIALLTRWPTSPEPFHAGTPLVAVAAVIAIGIVGALRFAWGPRSLATARFTWPAADAPATTTLRLTPAR
ncbi:MAG: hypothetical protein Q4F67_01560 [Propionibacteriaceae bacterium]|nr:hypothetical protein [Propionibacteriaceae bacterium]